MDILDKLVAPNEIIDKANLKNLFFPVQRWLKFFISGQPIFFLFYRISTVT